MDDCLHFIVVIISTNGDIMSGLSCLTEMSVDITVESVEMIKNIDQ